MQNYQNKPDNYFSNARTEIKPLIPPYASRVLEVGCGSGETLSWLKKTGRCETTTGIELFDEAAEFAKNNVDNVIVGNAEVMIDGGLFEDESFDLILCLDVLEHMVDPWQFVQKVSRLLKPDGVLVASIPNVRNVNVILPLIFRGNWHYQSEGILDKTHLRFFTKKSACDLFMKASLNVDMVIKTMPYKYSKQGIFNILTLGALKELLAVQFLISARQDNQI